MKTIRNFFARLFGTSKPAPVGATVVKVEITAPKGFTARLNPQVPPKRMPVPQSRAMAAASVPRRAPAASASRSSTTDDGMSMLPAAMLLSSHSDEGSAADSGSFGSSWSAPVGRGGSFDGGGASGNWDSGSSSSSDSGSSSDSSTSSCSSD